MENKQQRGTDLRLELTITSEEAAQGCQKEIVVLRDERCQACDGKSQDATASCGHCHGDGRIQKNRRIALKIPAGVKDGMNIRLTGAGNAGTSGATSGNIYIALSVTSAMLTNTPPGPVASSGLKLSPNAEQAHAPLVNQRPLGIWQEGDGVDNAYWKVGDIVDNVYQVTALLGEGGMGKVYKVLDLQWNQDYAVKIPRTEFFVRNREDFIREALIWVRLRAHPHIVKCYLVHTIGGIPRIFAEYVEGKSLADWIRVRRIYQGGREQALGRVLDVAIQVAWGLHAAHEQGVIHQDVKPANILMLADGTAKVTDFGLARARALAGEPSKRAGNAEQSMLLSAGGMTPAYCSPEQAAGQPLSRKTDIWSWGVSVLHLFKGEVSWASGVLAREILARSTSEDQSALAMPEGVVKLLEHCLQLKPEERPATMKHVADELQALYELLQGQLYPRAVPEQAPLSVETLTNQAVSLAELGHLEEALEILEQAILLDPSNATPYMNRGVALHELGREEEALAYLEQAIYLDPSNVAAFINLGTVLSKLERPEEALAAYEQVIRLDPGFEAVFRNRGMALRQLGRLKEALAAFEQALHLNPRSPVVYLEKGNTLAQLGQLEEALAAFEQALRLNPSYALAYQNKGMALQLCGRPEAALVALEQAIGLDPASAVAYFNKATALRALGREEEALVAYEQAIQLDPTKNPKPNYILRYFLDWGAGCCFWGANDAAQARFGYPIASEQLPLSESTIKQANELVRWHEQALNWEYPPDPGPWRQEECERFNQAAKTLLTTVRQELGERFEVIDEFVEEKEDPELDAYLRDPKGFQRKT